MAAACDVILAIYEAVNTDNLERLDDLIADDMVEHEEFPGLEPNKEGVKKFFAGMKAAFPDARMEAHESVGEGDMGSTRFTLTGTHQGEFMGVPASGNAVKVEGIDMLRVRDGQAVEHWGVMDSMSLMIQLGAIPAPA